MGVRLWGCEVSFSQCSQGLCVIWGFGFKDVGRLEKAQSRYGNTMCEERLGKENVLMACQYTDIWLDGLSGWRDSPASLLHLESSYTSSCILFCTSKQGPVVPGGPSNLAQLWLLLPSVRSSLHSSAEPLKRQKTHPGTDTLLSLSQGPPPRGTSWQSPCLTPPSSSPGRSPSIPTGALRSTLWSCSRWGAPASPSGLTLTAALRPPRSSGASMPVPATSFVSEPTPMSQGNGANL